MHLLIFCGGTIMRLDEHIKWCFKQKSGIKIIEPNDNLCEAYLKKANDSLTSMKANIKVNIKDWAIIAAYYARYNAIYAILMKCGIKSEIHSCTIALVKYLFQNELGTEMFNVLQTSKQQRIDVQYYTNKEINDKLSSNNINSAAKFVIAVEKLIYSLKNEKINFIRKEVKDLSKAQ